MPLSPEAESFFLRHLSSSPRENSTSKTELVELKITYFVAYTVRNQALENTINSFFFPSNAINLQRVKLIRFHMAGAEVV